MLRRWRSSESTEKQEKLNIHILAVTLSILAVVCALIATFLFGTTGAVIASVLGAAAIVLGVIMRIRTGTKKTGIAIVFGVLAIVLAVSVSARLSDAFTTLRNKALEYKPDGIWAQVSTDTTHGVMGIISHFPKTEDAMNAMVAEIDELTRIGEKTE